MSEPMSGSVLDLAGESGSVLDLASDPAFQTIVREALKLADAELVLLFGSRARGDARDDSDYDVFVVVREASPARDLGYSIKRALTDTGVSSDVIVISAADYTRQQHDAGFLAWVVAREGRVLFSSGRVPPRSPAPSRVGESRRRGVGEGVSLWLERADTDLRLAELSFASSDPAWDGICFHAHACTEKLFKAVIAHGGTFPPRTHELDLLLSRQPDPIRADPRMAELCATMKPLFEKSRYPPAPMPTPDEARAALDGTRYAHRVIHEFLSESSTRD